MKYDVYHENFAGLQGYTAAKRSVFILDADGVVRYKWVSENPGVEPDYKEVKETVIPVSLIFKLSPFSPSTNV